MSVSMSQVGGLIGNRYYRSSAERGEEGGGQNKSNAAARIRKASHFFRKLKVTRVVNDWGDSVGKKSSWFLFFPLGGGG